MAVLNNVTASPQTPLGCFRRRIQARIASRIERHSQRKLL
jgi:hypothetical protein